MATGNLLDALQHMVVTPITTSSGQELTACRDMLTDARADLDTLREALGVSVEPHQTLMERMIEAAQGAAQLRKVAGSAHWAMIQAASRLDEVGGYVRGGTKLRQLATRTRDMADKLEACTRQGAQSGN